MKTMRISNGDRSDGNPLRDKSFCDVGKLDPRGLFVPCNGIQPFVYTLYFEDSGWYYEHTELRVDPYGHRYTKVTDKTVVHNSHGTDVDDYHYEDELSEAQAIEALRTINPECAEDLSAFAASCDSVYQRCKALICRHFPGLEPKALIYAFPRTTIVEVCDGSGRRGVVKIGLRQPEDVVNLRQFLAEMKNAGGSEHVAGVEEVKLIAACRGGKCIMAIKMPLLRPVFELLLRRDGVMYGLYRDRGVRSFYDVCLQAAMGLRDIHALGYVHHDIRPENMLIDEGGRVVIADLDGIQPLNRQYQGHIQSSSRFRAPELAARAPYGPDVDVFAWGRSVLYLYSMLPNRDTAPANPQIVKGNQILGRDGMWRKMSEETQRLLNAAIRATNENPAERIRDGAELVRALMQ